MASFLLSNWICYVVLFIWRCIFLMLRPTTELLFLEKVWCTLSWLDSSIVNKMMLNKDQQHTVTDWEKDGRQGVYGCSQELTECNTTSLKLVHQNILSTFIHHHIIPVSHYCTFLWYRTDLAEMSWSSWHTGSLTCMHGSCFKET